MTEKEITRVLADMGQPAFRGKQVFTWLHRGVRSFDEMSNLSKPLRQQLAQAYTVSVPTVARKQESRLDGTIKYLWELPDGNCIETVLMQYHHGSTVCISSQVGCRMGCAFCASTLEGRVRDLTAGEMMGQVLAVNRLHAEKDKRGVTNIVMMGSGEPLDNYENVIRFLRLVSAPEGIGVSLRNVSVSTCGLVPRIYDLARENLPITLSISLHAPTDEARQRIMPIAKTYSLEELLRACRDYVKAVGRRIVFEYALIEGVNTSLADADRLADLVRGLLCHVNLIPLNDVPERNLAAPGQKGIEAFQRRLEAQGVSVTRRREMGADIQGACGQLRRKHLSQEGTLA